MIILGIDPGCRITGFSVLKKDTRMILLLDYGALVMSSKEPLFKRVHCFYDFFTKKINQWHISELSLETPFLGKNAQNFLKLGYLRGIVYLLASQHDLILNEFSPPEIKQAITGFGRAEKDQVARVIFQLFPGIKTPKTFDVTDALAISLCGLWRKKQQFSRLIS